MPRGSRFKAVNTRDKNYTPGAIRLRIEQVDASIARYLRMLDTADRQEDRVAELRVPGLASVWRRCTVRCDSFRRWNKRLRMRQTIRSR
jgi:hypothetical protein